MLNHADNAQRTQYVRWEKSHPRFCEDLIARFYRQILGPGDQFVDVGASKGHHTFQLAASVGPTGSGFAVEANPAMAQALVKKMRLRNIDTTRVVNVAVSNTVGEARFFVRPEFDGWSSMFEEHVHPSDQSKPKVITTRVELLDQVIADGLTGKFKFMKLDIEHSEFNALRGAEKLLEKHQPVIIFENSPLKAADICGYDITELFAFFEGLGYDLYDIFLFPFDQAAINAKARSPLAGYYVALPRARYASMDVREHFGIEGHIAAIAKEIFENPDAAPKPQPKGLPVLPPGTHTFTARSGETFKLTLPETNRSQSCFAMSIQKAGSVLFDKIVRDLTEAASVPALAVEPEIFSQGVRPMDWPRELFGLTKAEGYVFYGFRGMGRFASYPYFANRKKLILLRDPRDMVTSFYFSMARSHSVPKVGTTRRSILQRRKVANDMDINTYVQQGHTDGLLNSMRNFARYLPNADNVTIYRYEDVIFQKRSWVGDIARQLDIDLPREILDAIADRHDLRPEVEDPAAHVRQVSPGNFASHLNEETLDYVGSRYGEEFRSLGYDIMAA